VDQHSTEVPFLEGVVAGRKEAVLEGHRNFGVLGRKEVVELFGHRSFGVVLFAVGPRVLSVVLTWVFVELEVLLS
jgi:hypothetical protein